MSLRQITHRARNKLKGLCYDCGKESKGFSYCLSCRKRKSDYNKSRWREIRDKFAGICIDCGGESIKYVRCLKCRLEIRRYHRAWEDKRAATP